jgi:hypothetical protein
MLQKKIILELVWWCVTALLVAAILYPILSVFKQPFPFLVNNIICIVVLFTYTRHIFLLEHTLIARQFWIKMGLLMLTFPLMFWLINANFDFREFLDYQAPDGFIKLMQPKLSILQQTQTLIYIRNEFLFFVIGSMIATLAMFVRMLMSIWRGRNTGEV